MNKIELIDGTVIEKVKLSLTFPVNYEIGDYVELHIEGIIVNVNGWYSNVIRLEDLSSVFAENDLVRVKFALAKMNSALKIK